MCFWFLRAWYFGSLDPRIGVLTNACFSIRRCRASTNYLPKGHDHLQPLIFRVLTTAAFRCSCCLCGCDLRTSTRSIGIAVWLSVILRFDIGMPSVILLTVAPFLAPPNEDNCGSMCLYLFVYVFLYMNGIYIYDIYICIYFTWEHILLFLYIYILDLRMTWEHILLHIFIYIIIYIYVKNHLHLLPTSKSFPVFFERQPPF